MTSMMHSIIDEIDKIVDMEEKIAEIVRLDKGTQVESIAIFDLAESTSMKFLIGHDDTIQKMFLFNKICHIIVSKFKGKIIKDLGDGVLARFYDPLSACLTAVNLQHVTAKRKMYFKGALTLGIVEELKIKGNLDVFGSTVDRCARIEKCSLPNQILLDKLLYDAVETFLKQYDDIQVGELLTTELKGCGKQELHEIATKNVNLKNKIND